MLITKKFTFESAHMLEGHPKCGNIHGHSWKLEISIEGKIDKKTGMVMDFHDIQSIVNEKIIDKLDHRYLNKVFIDMNDTSDMDMVPTCENLVNWIWEQLEESFQLCNVKLYKIRLAETEDNYVENYGK